MLIPKKCAALEKSRQAAQESLENIQELMDSTSSPYEKPVYWAELHDTASMEARKMIVNQLIKRVDVGRNYQVNITLNFSYAQFMQGSDLDMTAKWPVFQRMHARTGFLCRIRPDSTGMHAEMLALR